MAVSAIDGTSRLYTDRKWNQELYYLGHQALSLPPHSSCFWCVWDNTLHRFEFGLMRQLGTYLIFPEELCLLADKIYPNRTPVLTPYTFAQLARRSLVKRRSYRKFNSLIRKYRIRVEHAIADLKTYKYVGHFGDIQWICTVCASLVCRRKVIGLILWK